MLEAMSFKWDGNAVMWLGKPSFQLPSDLIRYQEIIFDCKPLWIIETGSGSGGTTAFLQAVCNCVDCGVVIGTEDSIGEMRASSSMVCGERTMVILDSDVYSRTHMQAELAAYADLVTPGQYLIVCHTDREDWGASPAIHEFMRGNHAFEMRPPPV